jgi:hypothetical protein
MDLRRRIGDDELVKLRVSYLLTGIAESKYYLLNLQV